MEKKSYAKISLPHITKVYQRERLFGILDKNREHLATFISAPPGTGKTTLVASYIAARDLQYLWYQVDEGDDDLASFFHYMGLAFQNITPNKNIHLPNLTAEYSFGINTFCKRYFEAIYHQLTKPFVLVLDNFQEISETSPLHELLSIVCTEIPEHGHVILISRQKAPSPLARLLAHREMSILDWQSLRFTLEETQGFLQLQDYPVASTKELNRIVAQTEGWVAGLLHLQNTKTRTEALKTSHGTPYSTLFDYFAWEIFKNFDEDKQETLLQSAFLPTMTTHALEVITGRSDSIQTLESMCRENYFTVRKGSGTVSYQYHPMFREFLLNRSHELYPNKKIRSIKSAAADILENEGELEDAVSLLGELKDWEKITRIIIQNAPQYMSQGRYKTIGKWLGELPEDVVNSNPWLLYWTGISHLWINPVESQVSIQRAYNIFKSNGDPIGLWLSWSGVVDSIFIEFSNFSQFDFWVRKVDQLLKDSQIDLPPDIGIRVASSMLSILAFRQPQNEQLRIIAEDFLQRYKSGADQNLVLMAYSHLVTYYI